MYRVARLVARGNLRDQLENTNKARLGKLAPWEDEGWSKREDDALADELQCELVEVRADQRQILLFWQSQLSKHCYSQSNRFISCMPLIEVGFG